MNSDAALDEAILHPDLRHINFFNGRLLTGGDLQAEQSVQHAHTRHLGRALGTGVSKGLSVSVAAVSSSGEIAVVVTAGLAVSGAGETLCLECDQRVVFARPPDPAKRDQCVFADCSDQRPNCVIANGAGYYVLTISAASLPEGRAPVSGLGNDIAPCNSRYWAEGVKFRLLRLKVDPGSDAKVARNRVAYQCLGWPERKTHQFIADALGETAVPTYGFETKFESPGSLDHDVALAVVQWTDSGMGVIDSWPVRRRVSRQLSARPWDPLLSDRRLAEGEAALQQFQDQIRTVVADAAARADPASARFAFLPPAGLLPVGPGRLDWRTFLDEHAPAVETPLDPGLVRSVIRRSLLHDPVEVIAKGKSSASNRPIAFHIYRIAGLTDTVLFARSSLAEVLAGDVTFDDTAAQLGATDVQGAIDALAKQRLGCCEIVIAPGKDWQRTLESLPNGKDAHLCFQPGEYPLANAAVIKGKGHLVITGAGQGTRIVASQSEAALVFTACASVTISQLSVQGGAATSAANREHINGALTIEGCTRVHVERIFAGCVGVEARSAACIVVKGTTKESKTAMTERACIVRCECVAEHGQVGILLVDVNRSTAEENVVRAAPKIDWKVLLQSATERLRMRRILISGIHSGLPGVDEGSVAFDGVRLSFKTPAALRDKWQTALEKVGPKLGAEKAKKLAELMTELAGKFIEQAGKVEGMSAELFKEVFGNLKQPSAASGGEGIVVAGETAAEVRILNNTITRFRQGIHVGFSHKGAAREKRDSAELVLIAGNRTHVFLPIPVGGERHGIFVGNCQSVIVENNSVLLERTDKTAEMEIDGIRLFGEFGRRVIVRGNHIDHYKDRNGFTTGIHLRPLNVPQLREKRLWIVTDNVSVSSTEIYRIPDEIKPFVHGLGSNFA